MNEYRPLALPSHEDLARLARDDPPAYEVLRRQLIDDFIARAPAHLRRRLRGLQFQIDGVRRLSRSALGATVKIYQLMWNSFLTLNDHLQDLSRPEAPLCAAPGAGDRPAKSAQIIPFRAAQASHRQGAGK